MPTAIDPSKCGSCAKTSNLKLCAKCHSAAYCSRDCQKSNWKAHKKICAMSSSGQNAAPSMSPGRSSTKPKGLTTAIDKPFHKLDDHTWMHNRPEQDVYKLLIDVFRLRVEDTYTFDGDVMAGTVHDEESSSLSGFIDFLKVVERKPELLPPWWSPEKREECCTMGMRAGWSSLRSAVEKSDITEHYGNPLMPMQLRMYCEDVYGKGPGGADGSSTRKMMMLQEGISGAGDIGNIAMSHLDISGLGR